MAASTPENDYVALVANILRSRLGDVVVNKYYSASWESMGDDRSETLEFLDKYLDKRIDLITVQLGENVSNLGTFKDDFRELIEYIIKRSPDAQIIVIGDFWNKDSRDEIKKEVSKDLDVAFVSLSEIKDNQNYMVGLGATVVDSFGEKHVIEHSGVAKHPGDRAMNYIADRITESIIWEND